MLKHMTKKNIQNQMYKIKVNLEQTGMVTYNVKRGCFRINNKDIFFENNFDILISYLKENLNTRKVLYKMVWENKGLILFILGREKFSEQKRLIKYSNSTTETNLKSDIQIYTMLLNAARRCEEPKLESIKQYSAAIEASKNMLQKLKEWKKLLPSEKYNVEKLF